MCKYIITEYRGCACDPFVTLYIPCEMKEGVEYPHFLRCETTKESFFSDKECNKCRRKKTGADLTTADSKMETKSRFLGGPHGWNLRNFILRKKRNEVEMKQKIDIPLVVESRPPMFAPSPKVIEPTSANSRAVVHLRRENALREHPLRRNPVHRKSTPVAVKQEEKMLFCDDRPSTAAAAQKVERDTKHILNHRRNHLTGDHNPAATQQNAEEFPNRRPSTATAAAETQYDPAQILNHRPSTRPQYCHCAAARQDFELSFDNRLSTPKAARKQQDTQHILNHASRKFRPPPLTQIIPELQSYAPFRPPIDTNKLSGYLNEIAVRPRAHRPLRSPRHSHLADEDDLFLAHHTARYTVVRQATAAALQRAAFLEREVEELPKVPGPPKPQTLKKKKAFNPLTSAQPPTHLDLCGPQMQVKMSPPQPPAIRTRPRTATPAPLNLSLTPKLERVRTAPSSQTSPGHTNSGAESGWEGFAPLSPLNLTTLVVRKKMSPPGRLHTRAYLQTKELASAIIHVPRRAPRIPRLPKVSPLMFEGTSLEYLMFRGGRDR